MILVWHPVNERGRSGQGLKATVIATDGIAVIVNNDNPTEELSSDQVKSIYTGETYTWDEVTE